MSSAEEKQLDPRAVDGMHGQGPAQSLVPGIEEDVSLLLDAALALPTTMGTRSPLAIALGRLRQNKGALGGMIFIVAMALVAIFAPLIVKLNGDGPNTTYVNALNQYGLPKGGFGGISGSHWLGVTPQVGYDIFSRIVYGARVSLGISLSATILTLFLGVLVGAIAGFFPGFLDMTLSRFMDLLLAFPSLLFTIALIGIVPDGFPRPVLITLVFSGLGWPYFGRLVRTLVLTLREREFVDAARSAGASEWYIVFREVLPNLLGPMVTYASLLIPGYIVAEAGLSFLGVGIRIPTASWGEMLSDATNFYTVDPMFLVVPGLALFFTVFAFNLIGDGVTDAFNPKADR